MQFGKKQGSKQKLLFRKRKLDYYVIADAHIDDYKELQGKYIRSRIQEKHIAILTKDIGEGMEPTVEVVDGDHYHLVVMLSLTVMETPGHSIGSVTFVLDGFDWAFAADAVQMYGGAKSGIPTIEQPALYRKSLQHLLEKVRPKRLYLGHHFRNANGEIVKVHKLKEMK